MSSELKGQSSAPGSRPAQAAGRPVRPGAAAPGAATPGSRAWLAWLPLLAALLLATRPYEGIVHDARLYMMQTLARLHAEHLAADRYFVFGAQDSFSIFGMVFAPLVAALGPSLAHDLGTAAGLLLWFLALLALVVSLFGRGGAAVLAAAGVILLNPGYGTLGIFSYGEPFTTPRLFAEALVMAALALHRRLFLSGACLAAAAAIHPLMALPGIGVLGLLAAWREPRLWLLAAAGLLLLAGLAWAGVEPFGRLMQRFDAEWFRVVYERCAFAFLGQWHELEALMLLAPLAGIVIGWQVADAVQRRILAAVAIATALGILATLIGADMLHNVLVTSLQPWRALWLFTLFGNAFAAIAVLRLPAAGATRLFLMMALGCALAERLPGMPTVFSAPLFGVALGAHLLEHWRQRPLPRIVGLLGLVLGLLLAPLILGFAASHVIPMRIERVGAAPLAARALVLAAGAALLLLLLLRQGHHPRRFILVAGAVLLLVAAGLADRRTGWTRFVASPAAQGEIAAFLGENRRVYWEFAFDLLWFKQRMPSYFSCPQGSGVVFSAANASEWMRRSRALSPLKTLDFDSTPRGLCPPQGDIGPDFPPRAEDVVRACRDLTDLDALVLLTRVPGLPATEWRAPAEADVGWVRDQRISGAPVFHLYRCADLR